MNGTGFCGFKKIFNGFYLSYFVSCALPVEMSCFLLFNIPAFQERMAELEKEWLAPQFFCVFRRHLSAVGASEACPMQGYVRCRPILSFGGFARLLTNTQTHASSASLSAQEERKKEQLPQNIDIHTLKHVLEYAQERFCACDLVPKPLVGCGKNMQWTSTINCQYRTCNYIRYLNQQNL